MEKPYIFTSKKIKLQTLKMIEGNEQLLKSFEAIDESENRKLLPVIAYFYLKGVEFKNLKQVFKLMPELLILNKVAIMYTKKGALLNNELYSDWLKFSEKIDAINSVLEYDKNKKLNKVNQAIEVENGIDTPIFIKNGIKIYEANDVGACIRLGKGYSFCISAPGNTMYQSYRDSNLSTFYFIYDTNQKDTPLSTVVFDHTKYGIELTDEKNDTGNIYNYGTDTDGYIDYLESKGVPVFSLLNNRELSMEEVYEQRVLREQNGNLKWFVNLTPDYKSKYIGRGHKLANDQFYYLFDNKLYDLLNQYLNIGYQLTEGQFYRIESKKNLLKTYIRNCYLKLEKNVEYEPKGKVIDYFNKTGLLDKNQTYPNGKTDSYYLTSLSPTLQGLQKYYMDFIVASHYANLDATTLLVFSEGIVTSLDKKFVEYVLDNGHYWVLRFLIGSGIDVTAFDNYIFRCASRNNFLDIITLLIDQGADVKAKENEAIRNASEKGYLEMVKLLIQHGADVTAISNCALRLASHNGHSQIVKLLLDNGANVDVLNNAPIRKASGNGHLELVKVLVSYGADITALNNQAIRNASNRGHSDMVRLLQKYGANITDFDNHAVRIASENGRLDVVKILIANGADITANENQAIRRAARFGHLDVVKWLISNGADITSKDNQALKKATHYGHLEVVKLLDDVNKIDVYLKENFN